MKQKAYNNYTERKLMELLEKKISELEMPVRTHSSFQRALLNHMPELKTIKDLILSTEWELLRMPGFGRKSLNDVKDALKETGLYLGMEEKTYLKIWMLFLEIYL